MSTWKKTYKHQAITSAIVKTHPHSTCSAFSWHFAQVELYVIGTIESVGSLSTFIFIPGLTGWYLCFRLVLQKFHHWLNGLCDVLEAL